MITAGVVSAMKLRVNGNEHQFNQPLTAAELVEHLGLQGRRIAMEVNQEIVPRSGYPNYVLKDNDRVEIIHAVGGG